MNRQDASLRRDAGEPQVDQPAVHNSRIPGDSRYVTVLSGGGGYRPVLLVQVGEDCVELLEQRPAERDPLLVQLDAIRWADRLQVRYLPPASLKGK